ncbi:MAG: DUF1826 domain-containing protein [Pseudomonadota bacterium]
MDAKVMRNMPDHLGEHRDVFDGTTHDYVDVASSPAGSPVQIADTLGGLAQIKRPGVQMVVWRRELDLDFGGWVGQFDEVEDPRIRVLIHPTDTAKAIEPLLDRWGISKSKMRADFIADITDLAAEFGKVAASDLVDVRLEFVFDGACWKFHRDSVDLRLITTYFGPATEWVRPANADRALHEQRDYAGPIETMQPFEVAFFKGKLACAGDGIVHRSPAIAGTNDTRLLLCLNTPSPASPDPWQPS